MKKRKRMRDLPTETRKVVGLWCMSFGGQGPAGSSLVFHPNGRGYFAEENYTDMYYLFFKWDVANGMMRFDIYMYLLPYENVKKSMNEVRELSYEIKHEDRYMWGKGSAMQFQGIEEMLFPLMEYTQFPHLQSRKRLNDWDFQPWRRIARARWNEALVLPGAQKENIKEDFLVFQTAIDSDPLADFLS